MKRQQPDPTSLLLLILGLTVLTVTLVHGQSAPQPRATVQSAPQPRATVQSAPQPRATVQSDASLLTEWIVSNRQNARSVANMVQAINMLIQRVGALEFKISELEKELREEPITDSEVEGLAKPPLKRRDPGSSAKK